MKTVKLTTVALILFSAVACSSTSDGDELGADAADRPPSSDGGLDGNMRDSTTIDPLDAAADRRNEDSSASGDAEIRDVLVDAAPIVLDASDGGVATFDIVSPDRCVLRFGRLQRCVFAPVTVRGAVTAAAPVHSVVTTSYTGNCSSSLGLILGISAPNATNVRFHVADKTTTIRRLGDGPLEQLEINDEAPLAAQSNIYDPSCRITGQVQMNVPGSI